MAMHYWASGVIMGLMLGGMLAFGTYYRGYNSGATYGKAVAYRWCSNGHGWPCSPDALGLPTNVRELPFEALSKLP